MSHTLCLQCVTYIPCEYKKGKNFHNIYIRIQRKICDSIQRYPREDFNLREMHL